MKGDPTLSRENPIGSDLEGEKLDAHWEYASMIGMLMFLMNTQPDIQFSVHQCAWFTHAIKMRHKNAVKRILCYLVETQQDEGDRGLTFDIGDSEDIPKVECYVDADFEELWCVENDEDPVSSKSRTGFVIFVWNWPVIWQSRLQGETALSTMEIEIIIIALSQSMRVLIWL